MIRRIHLYIFSCCVIVLAYVNPKAAAILLNAIMDAPVEEEVTQIVYGPELLFALEYPALPAPDVLE